MTVFITAAKELLPAMSDEDKAYHQPQRHDGPGIVCFRDVGDDVFHSILCLKYLYIKICQTGEQFLTEKVS